MQRLDKYSLASFCDRNQVRHIRDIISCFVIHHQFNTKINFLFCNNWKWINIEHQHRFPVVQTGRRHVMAISISAVDARKNQMRYSELKPSTRNCEELQPIGRSSE
jgi:hypothetical protein